MTHLILPGRRIFQILLLLAAIDSLGAGLWATIRPTDLLPPVNQGASPDAGKRVRDDLLLWKATGALAIAQAGILGMLVLWPESLGPLVIVPLIGRCLTTAVWLWLLASDRDPLGDRVVTLLAIHDAVWMLLFASFLFAWVRQRIGRPT